MARGSERVEWIVAALQSAGLDALICTLPENVLMLSGYWPVVGTSICVATRDGRIVLLAPGDERDLALRSWAAEIHMYDPGSLHTLTGPLDTVGEPLRKIFSDHGLLQGVLGCEEGGVYEGSSYAAMFLFGIGLRSVVADVAPEARLGSGARAIAELRTRLTREEVGRVRLGCEVAGQAYSAAAHGIRPGLREPDVAAALESPIQGLALGRSDVQTAGAFAWCMSGENSALAGAAYARTRDRELRSGDFVLVHCNSYIDGYWTDITRTFCLGAPEPRQRAMYEAVFAARAAALSTIKPGAGAAEVDRAARQVLEERGFGQYFTHGLGHNVGFSVISAEFPPRLHPASPDRLAPGMTFNVEPSIYIKGYGGVRHCDVVTVHEDGPEVLTPFLAEFDTLLLDRDSASLNG